ncbi:hypothetical protein F5Y03DRAFT_247149 [Xylaria venustula]|nr:hypothetical protein F5Y03DRAFT_247149 [Xylaria venustula]
MTINVRQMRALTPHFVNAPKEQWNNPFLARSAYIIDSRSTTSKLGVLVQMSIFPNMIIYALLVSTFLPPIEPERTLISYIEPTLATRNQNKLDPINMPAFRHICGCQGTKDILPKLVSFFHYYGDQEAAYSDSCPLPEDLGLKSACLRCQLKTESGVEMAISAMHCAPDSLIEDGFVVALFMFLIDLQLQQEEDWSDAGSDYSDSSSSTSSNNTITTVISRSAPEHNPAPWEWDWDYIWFEFTKAFELRRNRVNVTELLSDLSGFSFLRHEEWWTSVLRRLGLEALFTFEGYVAAGLVVDSPSTAELEVLRRDVQMIGSVEDLFDLYVSIDSRVCEWLDAHKVLRARYLCSSSCRIK